MYKKSDFVECKVVDKMDNKKKVYTSEGLSDKEGQYNLSDLKNALNLMLYDDSLSAVDTFIETCFPAKKSTDFNCVKTFCIQSLVLLELILNERNILKDGVYEIFCDVWRNIDFFSNTDSIKAWFEELLKAVFRLTRPKTEDTNHKVIRAINEIIEKNYANIKNIGEIASQLFIS